MFERVIQPFSNGFCYVRWADGAAFQRLTLSARDEALRQTDNLYRRAGRGPFKADHYRYRVSPLPAVRERSSERSERG
jgi:hypothetical protein